MFSAVAIISCQILVVHELLSLMSVSLSVSIVAQGTVDVLEHISPKHSSEGTCIKRHDPSARDIYSYPHSDTQPTRLTSGMTYDPKRIPRDARSKGAAGGRRCMSARRARVRRPAAPLRRAPIPRMSGGSYVIPKVSPCRTNKRGESVCSPLVILAIRLEA